MMSLGQLTLAIDSLEGQRDHAADAMQDFGERSLHRQTLDRGAVFSTDHHRARADWLARLGPSA